jgi:hypothetical protein
VAFLEDIRSTSKEIPSATEDLFSSNSILTDLLSGHLCATTNTVKSMASFLTCLLLTTNEQPVMDTCAFPPIYVLCMFFYYTFTDKKKPALRYTIPLQLLRICHEQAN